VGEGEGGRGKRGERERERPGLGGRFYIDSKSEASETASELVRVRKDIRELIFEDSCTVCLRDKCNLPRKAPGVLA
jgi:hypothetical protein